MIVSTDPASNLQDVFKVSLTNQPKPIPNISGLFAANFDPVIAANEYREQVIQPYRGVLPKEAIRIWLNNYQARVRLKLLHLMNLPTFLTSSKINQQFDYIIIDTAPTGHTLRCCNCLLLGVIT